jgi:hypothetical protein
VLPTIGLGVVGYWLAHRLPRRLTG